ncbi:MAG: SDR family oxidoreductase [Propionibacteriaceae bacterium]|nr:SDR family oxidoreductase [Propionibacteriaceae bacterium]
MREILAITGVTGKIGGGVAAALQDQHQRLRLLVRDISRAPNLAGEVAVSAYGDATAARETLRDVDVLFMVSAGENPDRIAQHINFIDAAAAAGVKHVVYTSFLGASPDATFTLARDHWATEQHLRTSGMAWTFLRDSFYLDFLPDLAGPDGVIRGPAGQGRVGAVARADVIRVATAVLRSPADHEGRSYDLTGPQTLSLAEAAETITQVTGRPTSYQEENVDEAYASRASYGAPSWELDAWVSTYTAIASGELNVVSDAVERLTGAPPLSLAQVLRA